jgi:hypothetical protein
VHDSTAFQLTRVYQQHATLIRNDQWIFGDSAYPCLPYIVTPYKHPLSEDRLNKQFNYYLSKVSLHSIDPSSLFSCADSRGQVRIRSEHAMGYLKGQFQSLRQLRQNIDSEHDWLLALTWVRTCIIIHSLAFEVEHVVEDDAFWEWVHQGVGDDGDERLEPVRDAFVPGDLARLARESDGHLKRRQVQHALFTSLGVI